MPKSSLFIVNKYANTKMQTWQHDRSPQSIYFSFDQMIIIVGNWCDENYIPTHRSGLEFYLQITMKHMWTHYYLPFTLNGRTFNKTTHILHEGLGISTINNIRLRYIHTHGSQSLYPFKATKLSNVSGSIVINVCPWIRIWLTHSHDIA